MIQSIQLSPSSFNKCKYLFYDKNNKLVPEVALIETGFALPFVIDFYDDADVFIEILNENNIEFTVLNKEEE